MELEKVSAKSMSGGPPRKAERKSADQFLEWHDLQRRADVDRKKYRLLSQVRRFDQKVGKTVV